MTIISEIDREDPKFLWLHVTDAASLEFSGSRYCIAAEKWKKAYKIAQYFGDSDPRLAGSLNNMGIAFRIKKNIEQAARCYRNALKNWESAGHAGTLNNLAELFHSTHRFKEAEQFYHQALRKRIGSMGEREYGVAIINTNLAGLSDKLNKSPGKKSGISHKSKEPASFISKAEQQGWIVNNPSEFTDEGRLMAAILLTHLIDHTRL